MNHEVQFIQIKYQRKHAFFSKNRFSFQNAFASFILNSINYTVAQTCRIQNQAYSILTQSLHCLCSFSLHLALCLSCSKLPNCSLLAFCSQNFLEKVLKSFRESNVKWLQKITPSLMVVTPSKHVSIDSIKKTLQSRNKLYKV